MRVRGSLTSLALAAAVLSLPFCALGHLNVGDAPPDDLGMIGVGKELSLGTLRGKVVIVSFWATWCGPCMRELPTLEKIQRTVGQERLQVVMINFHQDGDVYDKLKRAFKDSPMILTYDDEKISKSFGVKGIPHMFMIDQTGKIAHIHVGYGEKNLDAIIDELNGLLAQGAAGDKPPSP